MYSECQEEEVWSRWLHHATELRYRWHQEARVLRSTRTRRDGERRHEEMRKCRLQDDGFLWSAGQQVCRVLCSPRERWDGERRQQKVLRPRLHNDCNVLRFGGSEKPEFCARHAKDEMVVLWAKICEQPNCTVMPAFGVAGSKRPEFCVKHAKRGMVNLTNKDCAAQGCSTKKASFGEKAKKTAELCAKHKHHLKPCG